MDDERTWWQRNRVKAVAGGCGGCLLLVVGAAISIAYLAFSLIKSSDAYEGALALAKADAKVIETLGEPIEAGLFVGGSVEVAGPSGEAQLSIPLSGPEGSGKLYVEATKSAGRWEFHLLELEAEGRPERIDLLEGVERPADPPGTVGAADAPQDDSAPQ